MAEQSFDTIFKVIDQVTGPIGAMNKAVAELTAKVDKLTVKGKATVSVGDGLAGFGAAAGKVAAALAGIAAAATGLALKAVADVTAMGSTAYKAAEALGVSVESFSGLAYAASKAGIDSGNFGKALDQLAQNARKAGLGLDEGLVVLFRQMGFDTAKLRSMKPDEIFLKVSDALANTANPATRSAVAMALMGEEGRKLAVVMAKGSEGIQDIVAAGQKLGVVFSGDLAKKSYELDQSWSAMTKTLQGVGVALASDLMPYIQPIVSDMAKWLSVTENQKAIMDPLRGAVKAMGEALKAVDWAAVIRGVGGFVALAFKAVDAVGGFGVVLGALVAIKVISLLAPLLAVTKAVYAFNFALLANPVAWIAVGILALGVALAAAWIYWDDIVQVVREAMFGLELFYSRNEAWLGPFVAGIEAVRDAFKVGFIDGIGALIDEWNPGTLLMKALTGLVRVLTGFDLAPYVENLFKPFKLAQRFIAWLGKASGPSGGVGTDGMDMGAAMGGAVPQGSAVPSGAQRSQTEVTVRFEDVPPGTRIQSQSRGPVTPEIDAQFGPSGLGFAY